MARKKSFKFPWRTLISIATVALVGYVVYENWDGFVATFNNLDQANIFVLILLIPEQLFMYFACGQIFFSYLEKKLHKMFGWKEKLKISTELNFVNRAVPAGSLGGLAYLTYRLRQFDITAGQASFLYIFRYAITTVINYLQALIAIIVLLVLGLIPEGAMWIIPVALLMNAGVTFALGLIIYIASSGKRINFFAVLVERLTGWIARIFTFGRRKKMVKDEKVKDYFADIHQSLKIAKNNKRYLKGPIWWGVIYSFCEIGTYWIVAMSLGRPELLPFIMVGEAIGSVFDGIVPYGLYELGMAGVMIALGVDFPTATIVTVMTRVFTLLFTIVSGSVPYYQAIRGKNGQPNAN